MNFRIATVGLVVWLLLPSIASAELLSRYISFPTTVGSATIFNSFDLDLYYDANLATFPAPPSSTTGFKLFDDLIIANASEGVVYTANASNEADWDSVVALINSGVRVGGDYLVMDPIGAPGWWSSQPLEPSYFIVVGIDIVGTQLDAIELEFTSLSIDSPGRNINNDGIWTDNNYTYELRFFGTAPIPEPATAVMMIFALPLICRRVRRRSIVASITAVG